MKVRNRLTTFLALVGFVCAFASCDANRIFEENQDIGENQWPIALAPTFSFEITDTTQQYHIFFNVRNAIQYPFYNLYLRHYLIGPDGRQLSSALHEMDLMDPKTGQPLGNGTGDIFDHRFRALRNIRFPQAGTYQIRLNQYMRQDPLPGIMSVGVRVEKAPTE